MNRIEELYNGYHTEPNAYASTDIFEHLPVLKRYASSVDHVTEMGVRWGASTIALGAGYPKTMVSYDIVETPAMGKVIKALTEDDGLDFNFILGDTLKVDIEETDMLFIDTLHTYNQLVGELKRHEAQVKKFMIFHDTVTFASTNEHIYAHASDAVKNVPVTKMGLWNALQDFLAENPQWEIVEHFKNNNGLTVIGRIK